MKTANMNDRNLDAIKDEKIPDVVLIKKIYPNRLRKRNWMLKHIEDPQDNREYRDFLDDLEDDKDFRQNVNIYVGKYQSSIYIPRYNNITLNYCCRPY